LTKKNFYGRPFGIPAIPKPSLKSAEDEGLRIWLPWNAMVAEGLLAYGKIKQAAEIFSRNMTAVIQNLKQENAFRTHYNAETGTPTGQRNQLIGLPSTGLFLEILGIRLLAGGKIQVLHKNPFPWDVKILWQGTSIHSSAQEVSVKFPNGEAITVDEQIPCLVENSLILLEEQP
jgi:hypothetical protein